MPEQEQTPVEENLVKVSPVVRQIVWSKLANFCDEREMGLYFFYEVLQILRSQCGEDILINKYGKEYDTVKRRLDYIGVLLTKVRLLYDCIDKKKIDDEKAVSSIKTLYNKGISNIPAIQSLIFEVFFLYLEATNLKYMSIPNQYLKSMERKYKKIDYPQNIPQQHHPEESY